jgi:fructose-1,6-bisphosphatase/inositol monophosphatase family enzyme
MLQTQPVPTGLFLHGLAASAADIMQKYFRSENIATKLKSDQTPVTVADLEISEMVAAALADRFPTAGLVCEERPMSERKPVELIVDELDGTAAFAAGIPTAVFAAAVSVKGELQSSVICDPLGFGPRRYYQAKRGQGALLNVASSTTQCLRVSKRTNLADYPRIGIATGPGPVSRVPVQNMMVIADELQRMGFAISGVASISYSNALLASGQLEAVVFPWKTLHDIAPGDLLVSEAGGVTSDLRGNTLRYDVDSLDGHIFSNSAVLHDRILAVVQKHY